MLAARSSSAAAIALRRATMAAAAARNLSSTRALLSRPPPSEHLPGNPTSPYLSSLSQAFFEGVRANDVDLGDAAHAADAAPATKQGQGIPTYRLMDGHGNLVDGVEEQSLELSKDEAIRIYETMLLLPAIDVVLYNAQRQGRISFMMTSHGEEAAIIGSAAALADDDEIFAQYREMGVLLWRRFSLDQVMDQVFGTSADLGKARQMPVHFGSTAHHFHTISSPLATQIPQAAGAAYALKRTKGREGNVAVCYFGEGAASEGDAHAGLNIAATTRAPVIFIVRNNGFAISTPSAEQYAGDGIASRGPGYGIPTIRVDGNDVLAVRSAVRRAKERALAESRPILVECMSYRVGHHSTSDDSSAYRAKSTVEAWKRIDNPLHRMSNFLRQRGWYDEAREEEIKKRYRGEILKAMGRAEKKKKPPLGSIFDDTYDRIPENLKEQRAELARLLQKYGDHEEFASELPKYDLAGEDLKKFVPRD